MSLGQTFTGAFGVVARALTSDRPFKVLVTGGSKCGKSTLIRKIRLRMGEKVLERDRQALKHAIYDEFIAFMNSNRADLLRRSRSVQIAEQDIPFFWSKISLQRMDDWDARIRAVFYESKDLPKDLGAPGRPNRSPTCRSSLADIFSKDWLPQDADVIECHMPGPDVEHTSSDPRILFTEVNMQALGIDRVKIIASENDLVVLVVRVSSPQADERELSERLSQFEDILGSQRAQQKFAHLIFNDFTPAEDLMVKDVRICNIPLGLWSDKLSIEDGAIAEPLCLLNLSCVNCVLKTWEEISSQKLLLNA